MKGNARIAPTAYYTAQVWVEGGFPEAERFATPLGRLMYHGLRIGKKPISFLLPENMRRWEDFIEARHHTIDRYLEQYRPDVIVEIAAGLSSRGLAYSRAHPDVRYHEFDLPHMVAAKRRRLPVALPGNYFLADGDILADDGIPVEIPPDCRLLVITEGLIPYLDIDEKQQAWRTVLKLLRQAREHCYLLDDWPLALLSKGDMGRWGARALGVLVGARMEHRLFRDPEDCVRAMESAGFTSVDLVPPALPGDEYGACPWRIHAGRCVSPCDG